MKIDLGDAKKIEVNYMGKTYYLNEPTFSDVEKLQAKTEVDDQKKQNQAFLEFIEGLGMPKDVVQSMGVITLQKLAKGLMGAFEEKKVTPYQYGRAYLAFHLHWSKSEIDLLPMSEFNAYQASIESFLAHEQMNNIISSGFFELKKEKRKQVWDDLKKKADSIKNQNRKPVSLKDVIKGLGVHGV